MNAHTTIVPITRLPIDDITLDPELQPRARIDEETWEEYLNLLVGGAQFPPVTVFDDGETKLLADGYHRWHAHKAAELPDIAVAIRKGSREDALRFSLSANAEHGKRRERGDYKRGYEIATKNRFVAESDVTEVRKILNCSLDWAYKLTADARKRDEDAERAAAAAKIAAKKAEGKSNRQISRETGIPHTTVDRIAAAPKLDDRKLGQDETEHLASGGHPVDLETAANALRDAQDALKTASREFEDAKPTIPTQSAADVNDMMSVRGQRWGAVHRLLRQIIEQPPVDELFADRYTRLDQAIASLIGPARDWIDAFAKRFEGNE